MSTRRPEGCMADRFRIGLATLNYLPRITYYLHVLLFGSSSIFNWILFPREMRQ